MKATARQAAYMQSGRGKTLMGKKERKRMQSWNDSRRRERGRRRESAQGARNAKLNEIA